MLRQTIASQQSEVVGIPAPADLIGDDPPGTLLCHIMVLEADQTDCSDCGRNSY